MTENKSNHSNPIILEKNTFIKVGITIFLLILFGFHITKIIELDQNALIILILMSLLWISPIIDELQISEYFRIKLKTAENNLELSKITAIIRLGAQGIKFLITEWEFDLLKKITKPNFMKNTNEGMDLSRSHTPAWECIFDSLN